MRPPSRWHDLSWAVELAKLTGCQSESDRGDGGDVRTNQWPTRRPQHHDRDATLRQVLLVLQILVGRDVEVETGRLSFLDERPILQLGPPAIECRLYIVATEGTTERDRCPLVEQDSQTASGRDR